MPSTKFHTLVFATAFAIMVGWLLHTTRSIIVPIVTALILAYILAATTRLLARLPVIGRAPHWIHSLIILLGFFLVALVVVFIFTTSIDTLLASTPGYQQNLVTIVGRGASLLGIQGEPTWESIRSVTVDRIDLQGWITALLATTASFGGQLVILFAYTSFMMAERYQFADKLIRATRDEGDAERILGVIQEINERVGTYLALKTLINLILAAVSYLILRAIGIDLALFWALIIGLLNYIPYVGSLLAVLFPVTLAAAQFGSIQIVLVTLGLLTTVQLYVGNKLEPAILGRSLNLSPLVVLIALSVWSALWGPPGAILAVPLTSVLAIICASTSQTRWIAVMLSDDGDIAETKRADLAPK